MKRNGLFRPACLFLIGGAAYTVIEIIWRALRHSAHTHWTMFIVGGLLFVLLGGINEILTYNSFFELQCLLGAVMVTAVEFLAGCVLNLWLGLHIWDYSSLPFNVLGQICPQFAGGWLVLSGFAIVLDDYLRFKLFDEESPHYRFAVLEWIKGLHERR